MNTNLSCPGTRTLVQKQYPDGSVLTMCMPQDRPEAAPHEATPPFVSMGEVIIFGMIVGACIILARAAWPPVAPAQARRR